MLPAVLAVGCNEKNFSTNVKVSTLEYCLKSAATLLLFCLVRLVEFLPHRPVVLPHRLSGPAAVGSLERVRRRVLPARRRGMKPVV